MILVYGFNVSLMNTNESACREHTYLRYVTTIAAISFPCWAAFDQYVATSRNVNVRNRWSSLRVVRSVIIFTVIFWILFYIPIIFYTGIINGVCVFKPSLYTNLNTYIFTSCETSINMITFANYFSLLNLLEQILKQNEIRRHDLSKVHLKKDFLFSNILKVEYLSFITVHC